MIESQSVAVYAFVSRVSMSFSVDETLLPRYVNLFTSFREAPKFYSVLIILFADSEVVTIIAIWH